MTLNERLDLLFLLGLELRADNDALQSVIRRTAQHNGWFTEANQYKALTEIKNAFLDPHQLRGWASRYSMPDLPIEKAQTVGLVMAGNIPLVGFHDLLTVFVAGHISLIKLSDKDPYLLPYLIELMTQLNPQSKPYFSLTSGTLSGFDSVIATGSNNSARYFEAYFNKYPHIIRKNRNAIAILTGGETNDELKALGEDVFTYFGLGCRNVSKLYVPRGYDFTTLLEVFHTFNDIILHHKYKNNFDYNYALLILNKIKYYSNGCILLRESTEIASPIAVLYFEYYDDWSDLTTHLTHKKTDIQCIVSKTPVEGLPSFTFGAAQKPRLTDYPDGVDTMQFLLNLPPSVN